MYGAAQHGTAQSAKYRHKYHLMQAALQISLRESALLRVTMTPCFNLGTLQSYCIHLGSMQTQYTRGYRRCAGSDPVPFHRHKVQCKERASAWYSFELSTIKCSCMSSK